MKMYIINIQHVVILMKMQLIMLNTLISNRPYGNKCRWNTVKQNHTLFKRNRFLNLQISSKIDL